MIDPRIKNVTSKKRHKEKKGGVGLLKDEFVPFSVKILVQQRCPAALKKKKLKVFALC